MLGGKNDKEEKHRSPGKVLCSSKQRNNVDNHAAIKKFSIAEKNHAAIQFKS